MDFVNRFAGRTQVSADKLFSMTDLPRGVQQHLQRVYLTLCGLLGCAAIGCLVGSWVQLPAILYMIAFAACSFMLLNTRPEPKNERRRYLLAGGAALAQGMTIAPLVSLALHLHPGVVVTALLGTSTVFACFSAAAILSPRRQWLFLGGALSSAVTALIVLRLGSMFLGGRGMAFGIELYVGLLVFVGYVLFDTQVIIEKANRGERDHIQAALSLFVDFVAILVRLLVILMQNAEKKEADERNKRKRRA